MLRHGDRIDNAGPHNPVRRGGSQVDETPLKPVNGRISIQVLADRSLTEIVGNDGRVFINGGGPAKQEGANVSVTARGGEARLVSLEAHELKSIWE